MPNTAPVGAYRGAGRPEGVFIVERLMDAAARQIGIDPRAIRKVNYIKPAQLPYTNPVGQVYDSGAFAHMLERAAKLADWDGFAARKKADKKKGLLYGRGLTSYIEWTGGRAHTEKVSLHATAEGRVILHSGTQAMGQGLQTTYTQMISESLGIPMDKIDIVQGDTDLATGFGSVGSRSLFVGGTAVAVSANDLIAKARNKASNLLEASVQDIEYRDGWLTVVGTDKRIGLFEIALDESAPCRTNPLGAKGCGESGAIGGPPCVANGVMDALSELGIKTLTTPLTPMKVWQAIRDAKDARV